MDGNRELMIGGIMLAAGGSSRLGQPKQFLEFNGRSLLRHAAEAMAASVCHPVVAVLGAEKEKAEIEIADLPVAICINHEWQLGMSTSIKAGLKELLRIEPKIDAVMITVCDQPLVTAQAVNRLAEKFKDTRKQMVAAEYDGVAGVPALFASEMFDALSELEGDKGARELLRDPQASIETIDIKEAASDIDTLDDMRRLTLP